MTALTGNHVSVTRMDAAYMFVRYIGDMTLRTDRVRYNGHIMVISMGGINYIRMTIFTVDRCLGINKILDICPGTLMTDGAVIIMLRLDTAQIAVKGIMTVGAPRR